MKIACISTYLPRECGIATFNHNLIQAIKSNLQGEDSRDETFVIAMNESDDRRQYSYPEEVRFIIRQERQSDYLEAAAFINQSGADACIIEHEFGIYGGESGTYLLSLIHGLKVPVITVLHTVLRDPDYIQKLITREIAKHSAAVVVMSKRAIDFLSRIYEIPEDKIQLIEHGVPDLEAPQLNPVLQTSPLKGKKVLFTFGLISRNKGLETVIRALPAITQEHPDVNYVVLGNTHPGVLKNDGEEYRESLIQLAKDLGVEQHLHFVNKFVSEEDLIGYLAACTLYVTPYLNEAQITSGTLSYAVGAGAAVLSTPYWHAQELLDDNRGRLFNFKDHQSLAAIAIELLNSDAKLLKLRQNAYRYGLRLRWPKIGAQYLRLLREAVESRDLYQTDRTKTPSQEPIPSFSLSHIARLTDQVGLIQHAKYGIPNRKEGYCLDDNARALILMLMAHQQEAGPEAADLFPVYLSYIHYMQRDDGYFRNFLSFSHNYLDEKGSEDSFGRAIWALGFLIHAAPNNSYREFGRELFESATPHFRDLKYIRGAANTLIGLSYYMKSNPSDEKMMQELQRLAAVICDTYHEDRKTGWNWFEDELTYDNAILPLSLFHAAEVTGDEHVLRTAQKAMAFLEDVTMDDDCFAPVGNEGWFLKGKLKPRFDQQPIETMAMILMYGQAYHLTKDPEILRKMMTCYQWFHGLNHLRIPLYDPETKGCCDGLQAGKLNRNQGAESTLAYLISHLAVLKVRDERPKDSNLGELQPKGRLSKLES
ncbi:glycosyltransferase [Arcticibacter sp. MXS-1]|uniref:glycosyltransferase n=1 Tax=Arcticibacter sp. MXS-1 TaxID=3341726 RepID=UPI0035A8722E